MAFADLRADGCIPGRVSIEHNHVFRVLTAEGEQLAQATGRLKHRATGRRALPVVGDWVALRPDPGGQWQIREVLPRHSSVSRKAAGRETEEQIIAANIDALVIVFGLDTHVKPRAIERYLVVARQSGAEPVVVLNKADLVTGAGALAEDVELARAAAGGAPVWPVSCKTRAGLDALATLMVAGRTVAMIGPSGAGKSTIVNHLVGREVLPTGEVRAWDGRGRHTSVHRQIVVREAGGVIIDTPGMRELQIWEPEAVTEGFADIEALAGECKFRDCRHHSEPGCAVKTAVDGGRIDRDRYESFLKLSAEQDETVRLRDERAMADAKRAAKVQQKRAIRSLYKDRQRDGYR